MAARPSDHQTIRPSVDSAARRGQAGPHAPRGRSLLGGATHLHHAGRQCAAHGGVTKVENLQVFLALDQAAGDRAVQVGVPKVKALQGRQGAEHLRSAGAGRRRLGPGTADGRGAARAPRGGPQGRRQPPPPRRRGRGPYRGSAVHGVSELSHLQLQGLQRLRAFRGGRESGNAGGPSGVAPAPCAHARQRDPPPLLRGLPPSVHPNPCSNSCTPVSPTPVLPHPWPRHSPSPAAHPLHRFLPASRPAPRPPHPPRIC